MLLELKNIRFSYPEKTVLKDISLTLKPEKFYGIIGPNGCGKTSLLDLIIGHKTPSEGTVYYRGKQLRRYARKDLAREIALVPQNFYINFPFTAAEIVMMGRYPHIPRFHAPGSQDRLAVNRIMDETGVAEFSNRYVTSLSSGERQRVVFARALAQDAGVLLLDEASSNLDVNHALNLLNIAALGVSQRGKTVIAVMQDINLAALYCEHLIFMKQGGIVLEGPTVEVLTPETIREVFGVETKVYREAFSGASQVVFRKSDPQD